IDPICTPSEEICDGEDNDCDGVTDEATCDDDNTCTFDDCVVAADLSATCTHTAMTIDCDDGNACTNDDGCQGGNCTGTPKACDDGNPCTTDSCDATGACQHAPLAGACDDGSACTQNDACQDGACTGGALDCDDGNPCTDDGCDAGVGGSGGGCVHFDNTEPCDDGDPCTTPDLCQDGGCVAGSSTVCDDGNPCTEDHCDPKLVANLSDGCTSTAVAVLCNDGNACTGTDYCKAGTCTPGAAKDCDDGNPCTADTCNTESGTCDHQPGNLGDPCDDKNPCTQNDVCDTGAVCIGAETNCDDGEGCTLDICDANTGKCYHENNSGFTCEDGSLCTLGDACIGGACIAGKTKLCDDSLPCTTDSCDAKTGNCVFAPNTDACDDGNPCTQKDVCSAGKCAGGDPKVCDDGNVCTLEACDTATGKCDGKFAADNVLCEDGDACSAGDACKQGVCTAGPKPYCDDGNNCTDDGCDAATGKCVATPNKAACDDGNPCTAGDICSAGSCTSGKSTCECEQTSDCASKEDGNLCNGTLVCNKQTNTCEVDVNSIVVCDPAKNTPCVSFACSVKSGVCEPTVKPDDAACEADDSVCTKGDVCQKGQCIPGDAVVCNDENPCTDDSCDPKAGCVFKPNTLPCFDGDPCTKGDQCQDGSCQDGGVSKDCDDNDVCTADTCNPKTGNCVFAPLSGGNCDDGNACTSGDLCKDGGCIGGKATVCDDGNPCTLDTCDTKTGKCAAAPDFEGMGCDDGKPCTKGDTCKNGTCSSGPVPDCDDGSPCTKGVCVPTTGECTQIAANNGGGCNDGNACTLQDVCKNGICVPADTKLCDDDNVCTADVCDQASGGCVYKPVQDGFGCDDGNLCTYGDACKAGKCTQASAAVCDDANPCTDDTCDAKTGKCVYKPVPISPLINCDDGNKCTYDLTTYKKYGTVKDACYEGKCTGIAVSCNDGNVCTVDSCDPKLGCQHKPLGEVACSDGNACTVGDNCASGSCKGTGKTCNDGNACTNDNCNPNSGCSFTPNSVGCNDGNKCTTVDKCSGGKCTGSNPLDCDDGKACTDDLCDPVAGCKHVNDDTNPCSDDEPCTAGDACKDGACKALGPTDCDDDNICTDESCKLGEGCVYALLGDKPCDDNNKCTEKDVCAGGKCASSGALDCNDSDVCTTDSCDPKLGCVHTAFTGPCDDGNACTAGDNCKSGKCAPSGQTVCDDGQICTKDGCDPKTGCTFEPATGVGNTTVTLRSDVASQTATEIVDNKPKSVSPAQVLTTPPSAWSTLGGAYWIAAPACASGATPGQTAYFVREISLPAAAKVQKATLQIAGAGSYSCQLGGTMVIGSQGGGGATKILSADVTSQIGAGETNLFCMLQADGEPKVGSNTAPCGLTWKLDVQVKVDSLLCDDGNACTSLDVCEKGACTGTNGLSCNDGNPCTQDLCDPKAGCTHKNADGAECSDGDACTGADFCKSGACTSTAATDCSDGNACTLDACDSKLGCSHVAVDPGVNQSLVVSSDTQVRYTKQFVVVDGQEQPVSLQFAVATWAGFAEWTKLAGSTWIWSDDIVLDPKKDETVWFGRQFDVPPGIAQLAGSFEVAADGTYECKLNGKLIASSGSDPKPWTKVAKVPVGSYLKSGENTLICKVTNPGDPNGTILTNPAGLLFRLTATWYAPTAAKPCDDGNACTKDDGCQAGVCISGPVLDCDDDNSCTIDACGAKGGCTNVADDKQACNDGSICTEGDHCDGGKCLGTTQKKCDDGNVCTVDGCDPKTGCLGSPVAGNPGCDDNNPCSANSYCDSGICKGGDSIDCNDDKPCTIDACDPKSGCTHGPETDGKPCDDGDVCTDSDLCANGLCLGKQTAPCDDGNACTKDSCDPAKGCLHAATSGGVCEDGDACTSNDVCLEGVCKAGSLNECFDTEQCTNDFCDSQTGKCVFLALSDGDCDDGNLCTLNDVCQGGKCKAGPPPPCGDGDPCTVDNCDPATGKCLHDPATEGAACDDGNLCTLETICASNKCVGKAKSCDDNNACTADSCDPATGKCQAAPISDGSPCGKSGSCKNGVCLEN
ncbi:MAG: extracellular matrix protein, partial [Pseudomonadota bacterium]